MQKYLTGALAFSLGCLIGLGVVLPAAAAVANMPKDGATQGGFRDPSFIGIRQYLLRETDAATQIVSNDAGLLYGICRMSQNIGDYTVPFDYYTADTLTSLITGMSTAHDKYIMGPYVYGDEEAPLNDGYVQAASVRGCWSPPWPVRFESGLVGKNNSIYGYSIYLYRTDEGGNPY